MSKKSPLLALLSDENHERVLADLNLYFGPRPEPFVKVFERMRAKQRITFSSSWSWPTFLLSFVWFFYRKMYLFGAVVILTPVVASMLLGAAGPGGVGLVIALSAKPFYVLAGLQRILKADTLGLTGVEREDYLQRAGGVSLGAGVLAGVLYALFLTAAIYGLATKAQAG